MQPNKDNAHMYSDPSTLNRAWLDWLATPGGSELMALEQAMLEHVLPGLRGYALGIASLADPEELVKPSKTAYQWWLKSHRCSKSQMTSVEFDSVQWPFEDGTLDVVVLHHSLDYAQWPHQTLREAARCLNPSGHLVVIGYNPFSFLGLGRMLFGRWSHKVPWMCRFINPWRVADWLTMLDCRVMRAYYTRPLLSRSGSVLKKGVKRFGFWPFGSKANEEERERSTSRQVVSGFWPGSSYMLVCKPETPSLTPIQKDWRRRQFTGLTIASRSFKVRPITVKSDSVSPKSNLNRS